MSSGDGKPIIAIEGRSGDVLSIRHNGQPIVVLNADGTLTLGPSYTPDTAAQAFWEAVMRWNPCYPLLKAKDAEIKRLTARLDSDADGA